MTECSSWILPLPGLDSHAGTSIILSNEDESLVVDQKDFNTDFYFIFKDSATIQNCVIGFLCSMAVFALLFLVVLVFYCKKLSNLDDSDTQNSS